MRSDLRDIINCLNANKRRATYEAVGSYLDVPVIGVGSMLGAQKPAMSWVVSSATGKPHGYVPVAMHEDLFQHEAIISRAEELSDLLETRRSYLY